MARPLRLENLAEHQTVKKQNEISGGQATTMDQKVGRHLQWECAAHEAAEEFFKSTGKPWSVDERKQWIDGYLSRTPYHTQNAVRTCRVCSDVIAAAMLQGTDPFACPRAVKEALAAIAGRLSMPDAYRYRKTRQF